MASDEGGLEILDEDECRRLLTESRVGRVGVTIRAMPAIFPVSFRFVDNRVVFFTGKRTKLAASLLDNVVAFQVDHVRHDCSGWNIQVLGVARTVHGSPDGAGAGLGELHTWTPADRPHLIAIHPEVITGRRLRVRGAGPAHDYRVGPDLYFDHV